MRKLRSLMWILLAAPLLGCQKNEEINLDEPKMAAFVELVLPRRIEIQKYLTKPVSYAKDKNADAIEVILAAIDAFEDPVKCGGVYHFELHKKRNASGDPVGDLLQRWVIEIDSTERMRQYWDRLSKFERFPLRLEGGLMAGKYVLVARLVSPTGEKLYDQYEFEYQPGNAPPGS